MRAATLIITSGLLCAALSTAGLAGQLKEDRADVALQAAIKTEMVDGDLKGAIEQYRRIAEGANRAAAARALVRMGQCQEKLGEAEARKAYERVVREYADQAEAASEARMRLASLDPGERGARAAKAAEGDAGPLFRKIEFGGQGRSHLARLSPDSSSVLYVDRKEKETRFGLYIMALPSGPERRLVDGVEAGALLFFEWSPDGRRVVYQQGRGEIRVVGVDGADPKRLWSSADPKIAAYPMDWSDDGRNILIAVENDADGTMQVAMLPSSGGELRTLTTQPSNEWAPYPQFSPDGRFVVGSRTVNGNSDLYVWSVDGGRERRLTEHPAKDESPLWSPDGQYVVFVSDRDRTRDLWALQMRGPEATGAPVLIKRNLGKGTWVTDCTRSGTLTMFMVGEGATEDLFVLPIEPSTGETRGGFLPFAKYPTDHFMPRWSPDGKRIAYTSRKGEVSLPRIYVSSGREKEDEEIPAPNYYVVNVEWARDGQSLIFPGWDPEERFGIFRISLRDFRIELLQPGGRRGTGLLGAFVNLQWLPHAHAYMFEKMVDMGGRAICTMDQDGRNAKLVADKVPSGLWTWPSPDGKHLAHQEGQELKLWSFGTNAPLATLAQFPKGKSVEGPAWSPDGRQIAWKDGRQLKVLSLSENTTRVLMEAGDNSEIGEVAWHGGIAWSPDGQYVAFVMQEVPKDSTARSGLWLVRASGGTARKAAEAPASHPRLGAISWNPGGTMVLASGGPEKTRPRTYEHWTLKNFLPKSGR